MEGTWSREGGRDRILDLLNLLNDPSSAYNNGSLLPLLQRLQQQQWLQRDERGRMPLRLPAQRNAVALAACCLGCSGCSGYRVRKGLGKNHFFSEISLENEILRKVFSKKMVF